jgi:hypothetical protein
MLTPTAQSVVELSEEVIEIGSPEVQRRPNID